MGGGRERGKDRGSERASERAREGGREREREREEGGEHMHLRLHVSLLASVSTWICRRRIMQHELHDLPLRPSPRLQQPSSTRTSQSCKHIQTTRAIVCELTHTRAPLLPGDLKFWMDNCDHCKYVLAHSHSRVQGHSASTCRLSFRPGGG